jgi:hypothetical protein
MRRQPHTGQWAAVLWREVVVKTVVVVVAS